ncbi:hypothetical protein ScPMuIL_007516 [Solemya velum]
MATVFERTKPSKTTLDDTVPLTCVVEAAQKIADHIEYTIRVQRGPISDNFWHINKRYSDFVALDTELKICGIELPLPPKKVFGNLSREFVAERQTGLQQYINTVLSYPLLTASLTVKKFLDLSNYADNFLELALQYVSMIFRSENNWDVVEPLPDIGWRIRKQYMLVRPLDNSKVRHMLSWCDFGPDKSIPERELNAILKLLPFLRHPHIEPVILAIADDHGGLVIQRYYEGGSLRDAICNCKPRGPVLKKYMNIKMTMSMTLKVVKALGRQILEALKFLQDKGLPYGHLHAGNIMLQGNLCKLVDLQNSLLGLPPYYRAYYTQFKKIQTSESIDVYSFGHVLYEMTFGQQLREATCDEFPPSCPAEIRSVLEAILSTEACKNGIPTVSDLLLHPLFSDVVLPVMEKPVLKIPSRLKEMIRQGKEDMEKRLREDQKTINKIKRISKAKEFHASDEEKKKRRKSKKKALLENGIKDSPSNDVSPDSTTSNTETNTAPVAPPPSAPPAPSLPPTAPGIPTAPPPAPSLPPPTPQPPAGGSGSGAGRGALLSSISQFQKGGLKKAVTKDCSGPRI